MRAAAAAGHVSVLKLLLALETVDPAPGLQSAAEAGSLAAVDYILSRLRSDLPKSTAAKVIRAAARGGSVAVLDRVLGDPRVQPDPRFYAGEALDHLLAGCVAGGHMAALHRLFDVPGVRETLAKRKPRHLGCSARKIFPFNALEAILGQMRPPCDEDHGALGNAWEHGMHFAAKKGHAALVAHLNGIHDWGVDGPLITAAGEGQLDVVDVLLHGRDGGEALFARAFGRSGVNASHVPAGLPAVLVCASDAGMWPIVDRLTWTGDLAVWLDRQADRDGLVIAAKALHGGRTAAAARLLGLQVLERSSPARPLPDEAVNRNMVANVAAAAWARRRGAVVCRARSRAAAAALSAAAKGGQLL